MTMSASFRELAGSSGYVYAAIRLVRGLQFLAGHVVGRCHSQNFGLWMMFYLQSKEEEPFPFRGVFVELVAFIIGFSHPDRIDFGGGITLCSSTSRSMQIAH